MKIDELAMKHKWPDELGLKIQELINSNSKINQDSLKILKSIQKEYYDSDDVVNRDQLAKNRIIAELPKEYVLYLLKY
jgi:hypothetical protein